MGFIKDFAGASVEFVEGCTKKSFIVYLDDIHTYSTEKDFVYPGSDVICEAIEKYAADNKQQADFISREKPVSFWLDRKEKYEAVLELGLGRVQGYAVRCVQIKE